MERFKPRDQDVRKEQKSLTLRIFLIEAANNLKCYQFTKDCSSGVDGLVSFECLLSKELQFIDEQTVDDGNIFGIPEAIDQRSHNGDVDPGSPQLLFALGIIDTFDELMPNAMDGCVNGQMCVRVWGTGSFIVV